MKKNYNAIVYIYGIWTLIFIVLPILILFVISFLSGDIYDISSVKFTLENYKEAFSKNYIDIIIKSLLLAFYCNIICLLIGYPCAYAISGMSGKKRSIMMLLLLAPMWTNFLLRTYSWMLVLGNKGPINSFIVLLGFEPIQLMYNDFGVVLGMVYNFLPFMILPIYLSLSKIDKGIIEAAKDLGACDRQVFSKIKLPLSIPGVFSGTLLVFLPAITSFVISRLLGGGQYLLLGNLIEHKIIAQHDLPVGSAISVVTMIILLFVLWILRKIVKNKLELSVW